MPPARPTGCCEHPIRWLCTAAVASLLVVSLRDAAAPPGGAAGLVGRRADAPVALSSASATAASAAAAAAAAAEDLSVVPGSSAWTEYVACNQRGAAKAAVDQELLATYAAQGEGFLDATSVVVDVGGFLGEAMQRVSDRFRCRIFIFEPVRAYVERLEERFRATGGRVVVLDYGIGARDENISFVLDGDASHIADGAAAGGGGGDGGGGGGGGSLVRMRTLTPFFEMLEERHGARFVDLLHVNCEGCEYSVLEYILRSPWIMRIRHLLVQFHSFRDTDAVDRRCTLRAHLAKTHRLAWDASFVWERWDLVEGGGGPRAL